MSWLPKDYKEPVESNYMKFAKGINKFRVMSEPIIGWEYWKTEVNDDGKEIRKPIRYKDKEGIPIADIPVNDQGDLELKHFWAFVVYNYEDERVQILEITQRGIQREIKGYERNEKWGSPTQYDFVITRTGEGLGTKYQVQTNPKEKLDKEIVKQYEKRTINLEALFNGGDPFAKEDKDGELDVDKLDKEIPDG